MSAVKERPILFSGPMVRAIIEGRKTQTRRVVKPRFGGEIIGWGGQGVAMESIGIIDGCENIRTNLCPYGMPGEMLYVKEEHYRFGHWESVPGVKTKSGRMKWRFVPGSEEVLFDPPDQYRKGRHHKDPYTPAWHKRPSLFMPRSVCRLLLEVTDVRVHLLQDISHKDAVSEGFHDDYRTVIEFWNLWSSIHGYESWDKNDFVWAVTFKRIDQ